MKKQFTTIAGLMVITIVFLLSACAPSVTLTSWKNPKENQAISSVIVYGMFEKLEYQKPFEQTVASYLQNKGLKVIEACTILRPQVKYQKQELVRIFDSLGTDGVLIVTYTGTDKTEDYVPPTTTAYPDYYFSYYNYYSWGYPMYAPGYNVVTTGGYWTTTTVVNLRANLYHTSNSNLLWTAQIAATDPKYVDEVSMNIASQIYSDWVKNQLVKTK